VIKHSKSYTKEENKYIFNKWKAVMQDLRMNIHFFDFVDNYYPKLKNLNVLTNSKWTKPDKTYVESSHPPKENILIKVGNELVKASPFKHPPRKIPFFREFDIFPFYHFWYVYINIFTTSL
jgi:hypothetical protein